MIDKVEQIKQQLEQGLSHLNNIHNIYVDYIPESDSFIDGKATIQIEGVINNELYAGNIKVADSIELMVSIYTDTKEQGNIIRQEILNCLKDYGFSRKQTQQRLDLNAKMEGSGKELTPLELVNGYYNGLDYFKGHI